MQGKRFLRYCAGLCAFVVVNNISGAASIKLYMEVDPTIVRAVGDTITYKYHVVNNGDEVISNIHIRDSFENDIDVETLAVGYSYEELITHAVTPDDYSMNEIVNIVYAVGADSQVPPREVRSNDVQSKVAVAKIALDLDVDPLVVVHAGDIIQYTYSVRNIGGAAFSATTLIDTKIGVDQNLDSLAAGGTTTYTTTYTVTQFDINTGSITNNPTVAGTTTVGDVTSSREYTVDVVGELLLAITATPTAVTYAGETIQYTYHVKNVGEVAVDNITLTDTKVGVTENLGSLSAGGTTSYIANYTVTQADIYDGSINNTATAVGSSSGVEVSDEASYSVHVAVLYVGPSYIYKTIAAGVSAAHGGDTILLEAGQTFTGTGNYGINIGTDLTFSFTGDGADPIIDLTGVTGYLFQLYSGVGYPTASINNFDIRNGTSAQGAIYNRNGRLTISNCVFSNHASTSGQGVIYNPGGATLSAINCKFNENSTTGSLANQASAIKNFGTLNLVGCEFNKNTLNAVVSDQGIFIVEGCTFIENAHAISILNQSVDIKCSRFAANTASTGSAIYAQSSTINAENNWWGTNAPDTATNLFHGTVDYTPWITMSLSANPSTITPGGTSTIDLTFSNTCIPVTPVAFSTTDGTLTSTLANTVDGQASSTFNAAYSDLLRVVGTAGPDAENYSLILTLTPYPVNPGISITKKINDSVASIQEPGVVVASDSMMDISYIITNTGNVTLNVEVTDDQSYEIIPSTTTLVPDANITCTAQASAPGINQLHKNIGTATGTTALSTVVTASASAYATSVPVDPYRFNFGCICSDTGEEHILIGSHNMPELDGNSLDFWMFNETPTVSFMGSLDLGQQIIMDSATYNTELGMNIAVLTQTQEGATAIILVTYDGVSTTSHSITSLSSRAFKAQWFVAPDSTPYIVTDEQNGMSLYEVNLATYELTLRSSTPNLGAGATSAFLRWYPQGDSLYVIQGYNQTSVATYKVDLSVPEIQTGVTTDMEEQFMFINSCATGYENLVLGGAGSGEEALLARCTVEDGELAITQTASIPDAFEVYYCERCCCDDNPILVGTDNGLYSLNANTLDVVALNTSMPNNEWINTCWCCDVTGDYCIAVNSYHETYVFKQEGASLNMVLQLPS